MRASDLVRSIALAAAMASAVSCGDVNTVLHQQSDARHRSAELFGQFVKAADASNRAVMATSDSVAVTAAQEAEEAKQVVQRDVEALQGLLSELDYPKEAALLQAFVSQFAAYRELDRQILDLVVEQTNTKAQRLAFGPATEAADSMAEALASLAPSGAASTWHVRTLAATAIASVREIQAVQAPHIQDPVDASMDAMEKRMAKAEAAARRSLDELATLVSPASRPQVSKATTALDRFMALNGELVALSRRNTNVRALALSLDHKQKLVAPCEESLRALRDALNERGYPAGRLRVP